jgi:L-cystine uptake protein TcyP (sodium:dicarboxylate symporter family)
MRAILLDTGLTKIADCGSFRSKMLVSGVLPLIDMGRTALNVGPGEVLTATAVVYSKE